MSVIIIGLLLVSCIATKNGRVASPSLDRIIDTAIIKSDGLNVDKAVLSVILKRSAYVLKHTPPVTWDEYDAFFKGYIRSLSFFQVNKNHEYVASRETLVLFSQLVFDYKNYCKYYEIPPYLCHKGITFITKEIIKNEELSRASEVY